ncbi:TetR family transcriptional regulator [Corallococcus exiguus]|uniref:TetR family transcriptional regulator n=1 Tax=Corallococcus TaxID=83461 RepID=UPI000ED354F8|nr:MULTISPECIES: TetR family transcriptional regulator [Corallococcus]NNB84264.1 TetR family transcriptional regulator [Corallococcus exiguus]NNB93826.1 TetR family transcriptional regulator [Corallococcus exiguus]NPC46536.1 TetR family transcriptional regulator [Corallococcus exiguus]RKH87014.1 TetR family transcriptional regulator [Corallococcus sp. AB032C]
MGRWEPNARDRLAQAAMSLFQEHGYDRTTVEEIAARAGLTERTFFRYFADKKEVLFGRSDAFHELIDTAITDAPPGTAPLDAVATALEAMAPIFKDRRDHSRARQALLVAHAELRERELIKLASLASAAADALRKRGVTEPTASLAAEAGIAVFKVAFERWLEDPKAQDLSRHIQLGLEELRAVTASTGTPVTPSAPPRQPARPARARKP